MKSSFVEEECPDGNTIRPPELGGSSGARVRKRAPGVSSAKKKRWEIGEAVRAN